MNRGYIIHYNEHQHIDAMGQNWKIFENPGDYLFTTDKIQQFTDAIVVFVQFPGDPLVPILFGARLVLQHASEVKIVKIDDAAMITEKILNDTPAIPETLLEMEIGDLENFANVQSQQSFHPAQDYLNGLFFYGTIIHGKIMIVTSAREYFSIAEAIRREIPLLQSELSQSNFRHETLLHYFTTGASVNPDEIFTRIRDYIRRHIYFQDAEMYDLIPVWVMGTYIFRAFRYYPYLHINAEKGSGKTLLMELMSRIAFNGKLFSQPAVSTVVKLIHQLSATLFIDEAESLHQDAGSNSQLKQILKTGFSRSGDFYVGETLYRTYSPKCFAGINDLDDVLADRTITVKMIRKTAAERVELYRETPDMQALQQGIMDSLYLFGLQHGPRISREYQEIRPNYDRLVHLSNRAYDVWLPLYMIVGSFTSEDLKAQIFNSLDKLSHLDENRRRRRDAEDNETGSLINSLSDALKIIQPLQENGEIKYYDPDILYNIMIRDEKIPKNVHKKGFSRLLKKALEIYTEPRAFGIGTKRMYAIDTQKFEEYKKRYTDVVQ